MNNNNSQSFDKGSQMANFIGALNWIRERLTSVPRHFEVLVFKREMLNNVNVINCHDKDIYRQLTVLWVI